MAKRPPLLLKRQGKKTKDMARPLALQMNHGEYENVAKKKKKKRNHVVERVPERSEDSVAKVGAEKENSLKMDSCNQYLLNIVDVCGRFHRK